GTLFYSILALITSSLLLVTSIHQLRALHRLKKRNDLARINTAIEKTKKALRCARWSAVEIAVLATHAGMTLHDIEQEYVRDASARQEVLTYVSDFFLRFCIFPSLEVRDWLSYHLQVGAWQWQK
ncbi:hypothetical protein OESDEN_24178, partial [Oesophagostomum dentatum]